MIHSKRVIFIVLPLLFVPLVHGMSSTPDAYAEPRDPNWGKNGICYQSGSESRMTCCWEEPDILNPGETIEWCQKCLGSDCEPIYTPRSTGPLTDGVFDPPTGSVSDDPQAGNNENPSIPPTEGVTDETENENTDTPTNTIPRKGGGNLVTLNLNESGIVQ